jgi:hypothetical protein
MRRVIGLDGCGRGAAFDTGHSYALGKLTVLWDTAILVLGTEGGVKPERAGPRSGNEAAMKSE